MNKIKRAGAIPEKNHAMMAVFRPGIVPTSKLHKLHKHSIDQSLPPTSQPPVQSIFAGDIAGIKGKVR